MASPINNSSTISTKVMCSICDEKFSSSSLGKIGPCLKALDAKLDNLHGIKTPSSNSRLPLVCPFVRNIQGHSLYALYDERNK